MSVILPNPKVGMQAFLAWHLAAVAGAMTAHNVLPWKSEGLFFFFPLLSFFFLSSLHQLHEIRVMVRFRFRLFFRSIV